MEKWRTVIRILFEKYKAVIFFCLFTGFCQSGVFYLYHLENEAFFYSWLLILFVGILILGIQAGKEYRRLEERDRYRNGLPQNWQFLPRAESKEEEDYQEMIGILGNRTEKLLETFREKEIEGLDYYTTWVHQIKTPIAVMRLLLNREDTKENRALLLELFRIEQYVDMVLQYIRLGSESNDLVIREYELDELVRQVVRKFAPQFIGRELGFSFQPSGRKIVTDQKWFSCILEQLLSNAIKYTPSGNVSIEISPDGFLAVKDTGMGIAAEDLPRIFERGFTGINGRKDRKSTGLGLYLCKKAADKLAIPIRAESQVGQGSSFILDLRQEI